MTARTQIGTVWGVGTQTGGSTSLVAPARTITAGSLVRCIVRGESSDATATATDSAGGTWTFVKARDSNVTVWLGYSWDHPGGTNVVVTVSFSGSQSYRSCTFVEHSGGDASDPYQSGSLASSVGSGAMNLSVPFTGDVSVFAGQGNYSNTSYTAVNGVLLQTTGYHACLIINSTSSSPANPRLTGSSGGVATIAAAFSDPAAAADTTPPTLSAATLTSTSATTSAGGITTNEAGPAWAVATTSATQPSAAQVKAGQDHTGTTAPSDTATLAIGANPAVFSFTGQTTSATYYMHVVQDDEADTPNTSDVESSAGEVIEAPSTITVNTLDFAEGSNIRMRMALATGLRTDGCTIIWREKRRTQDVYSGGFVFNSGTGSWDAGAWTALFVTHGCDGTYDSDGQKSATSGPGMYHEIAGMKSIPNGWDSRDFISRPSALGTQASYPVVYDEWIERAVVIKPVSTTLEHYNYVNFSDPTKVIQQNLLTSDPATPTNQYLDFGAPHWVTDGSEDFDGQATHIKVFSRGLSTAEIRQELDNFSDTPVVSDCWYSNYSPSHTDLTDKKPSGTAHPFTWHNGTATTVTADFDLPGTDQTLTPPLLTRTKTIYAPVVTVGAVSVAPPLLARTKTLYVPTVSVGAVTVSPGLLTRSKVLYTPSVSVGAVALTPPLLTRSKTLYAPVVSQDGSTQTLTPPLLTLAKVIYAPVVVPGAVSLDPALLTRTKTIYAPTVTQGAATLTPPLLVRDKVIYAPMVTGGAAVPDVVLLGGGPGLQKKRKTIEKGSYLERLLSPPLADRLERIKPEAADFIEEAAEEAIEHPSASPIAAKEFRSDMKNRGIAYRDAYREIYLQVFAEMQQAQEDEEEEALALALSL